MSEEFGPEFITVTDEDGSEFELEYVDTIEHKGQVYMAFFPADAGEDEAEDTGLIILKSVEVDGEEQLSTLDTEEELEEVHNLFMEELFQEDAEENEK